MSLTALMSTGLSGMTAQTTRLSAIAENIANSSTTGYKRAATEFSSLVVGNQEAGGVDAHVRKLIDEQGAIVQTSSPTDLAISGNGFLAVSDASGSPFLTRAGAFTIDANGELVNSAGFHLLGYPMTNGQPTITANSFSDLVPISLSAARLQANPSRTGIFTANLPSSATAVAAGDLPSANAAAASFSAKTSIVAYDNLGATKTLDIYWTNITSNQWEVAVYDRAAADPATTFPYSSGPLVSDTLDFSPANGRLNVGSPTSLMVPVPGAGPLTLDLANMTQLATNYKVIEAEVDGNAPSNVENVVIRQNGEVLGLMSNGTTLPLYQIPLVNVPSPGNLHALSGNVYQANKDSGDVLFGFAQSNGMGTIHSNALESANVDLGEELTAMIEAQRSYSANSKVFQTGAELVEILVNLKR